MTNSQDRHHGKLIIREATSDWKLETSYCSKCKFNNYTNIGHLTCAKCGQVKCN